MQALSTLLCPIPLASIYYSTPIDPTIIICFNYGKEGHFASSCLELKNINNIEEIEEEEIFNKLRKEKP